MTLKITCIFSTNGYCKMMSESRTKCNGVECNQKACPFWNNIVFIRDGVNGT